MRPEAFTCTAALTITCALTLPSLACAGIDGGALDKVQPAPYALRLEQITNPETASSASTDSFDRGLEDLEIAQGSYGEGYGEYEYEGQQNGGAAPRQAAPAPADYEEAYRDSYDQPAAEPSKPAKKKKWWWPFGGGSRDEEPEEAAEEEYLPPTNATGQRWGGPTELKSSKTPSGEAESYQYRSNDGGADKMKWLKTRYPDLSDKDPDDVRMRRLLDRAREIKEKQQVRENEYLEQERRFQEESLRIQEGMGREFEAQESRGRPPGPPPGRPMGVVRPPPPPPHRPDHSREVELGKQKLQRLMEKRQNLIDVGASPDEIVKIDEAIGRLRQMIGH